MEDFINIMDDHLAEMRLIAEGAVALYESDQDAGSMMIYNLIGEALYILRDHVCQCQNAYHQEIIKLTEQEDTVK